MRKGHLPRKTGKAFRIDPVIIFFSVAFVIGSTGGYFCCVALGIDNEIKEYLQQYANFLTSGGAVCCIFIGCCFSLLSVSLHCFFVWPFLSCFLYSLRPFYGGGIFAFVCGSEFFFGTGKGRNTDFVICVRHSRYVYYSDFSLTCPVSISTGSAETGATHSRDSIGF